LSAAEISVSAAGSFLTVVIWFIKKLDDISAACQLRLKFWVETYQPKKNMLCFAHFLTTVPKRFELARKFGF
jgi:hypothetical protein